jgi:hypothetical protein
MSVDSWLFLLLCGIDIEGGLLSAFLKQQGKQNLSNVAVEETITLLCFGDQNL